MGVARRIETPAQAIKRLEREIESLQGLAVATRGDFLSPRLSLRTREGTDFGVANDTLVIVTYDSVAEVEDDENFFDTTGTVVTIRRDGIYQIDASVFWSANTSGYRRLFVYHNNEQAAGASAVPQPALAHFMSTTWVGRLAEGDEIT